MAYARRVLTPPSPAAVENIEGAPVLPPDTYSVLAPLDPSVIAGDTITVSGSSICSLMQLILEYSVTGTGERRVHRTGTITGTGPTYFSFETSLEIPPRASGPAVLSLDQGCQAADSELLAEAKFVITQPASASPAPTREAEGRASDGADILLFAVPLAVAAAAALVIATRRRRRGRALKS